jgi:uncharacterized membrane protein/ribosomal protein L40E
MSLESGRKLGLAASLITIIVPIIAVALFASFFILLLSVISGGLNSLPSATLISGGFSIGLIAICALSFAAFIIFLISIHRLSEYFKEPAIFRNVLYALILEIVAVVLVVVLFIAAVFSAAITTVYPSTSSITTVMISLLGVVGVFYVMSIVAAVLFMRALNRLADKSGVDNFRTFGLLFLIGVLLAPVAIGCLIIWIGWIFALTGFHKLRPTPQTTPIAYQPPANPTFAAAPLVQKKFCGHCGAENSVDAIYCRSCGKPIT